MNNLRKLIRKEVRSVMDDGVVKDSFDPLRMQNDIKRELREAKAHERDAKKIHRKEKNDLSEMKYEVEELRKTVGLFYQVKMPKDILNKFNKYLNDAEHYLDIAEHNEAPFAVYEFTSEDVVSGIEYGLQEFKSLLKDYQKAEKNEDYSQMQNIQSEMQNIYNDALGEVGGLEKLEDNLYHGGDLKKDVQNVKKIVNKAKKEYDKLSS